MVRALTIRNLFDPRGRIDRKGLFWLALVLTACQAIFAVAAIIGATVFDGSTISGSTMPGGAAWEWDTVAMPSVFAVKLVLLWISFVAVTKRLHDIGLSAIWLLIGGFALMVWTNLAALAAVFMLGLTSLNPTSPAFVATFAICLLPMVVALIWLHLAKGERAPNQYGVPPGLSGFSGPPALITAPAPQDIGLGGVNQTYSALACRPTFGLSPSFPAGTRTHR